MALRSLSEPLPFGVPQKHAAPQRRRTTFVTLEAPAVREIRMQRWSTFCFYSATSRRSRGDGQNKRSCRNWIVSAARRWSKPSRYMSTSRAWVWERGDRGCARSRGRAPGARHGRGCGCRSSHGFWPARWRRDAWRRGRGFIGEAGTMRALLPSPARAGRASFRLMTGATAHVVRARRGTSRRESRGVQRLCVA